MDLALFDFDGTITRTDTWTPFMQLAVRPARIVAGRVLLSPVVVGYKLGMISASRGRQVAARVGFRGEDAARMQKLLDVLEDLDDTQAVYHNADLQAA